MDLPVLPAASYSYRGQVLLALFLLLCFLSVATAVFNIIFCFKALPLFCCLNMEVSLSFAVGCPSVPDAGFLKSSNVFSLSLSKQRISSAEQEQKQKETT